VTVRVKVRVRVRVRVTAAAVASALALLRRDLLRLDTQASRVEAGRSLVRLALAALAATVTVTAPVASVAAPVAATVTVPAPVASVTAPVASTIAAAVAKRRPATTATTAAGAPVGRVVCLRAELDTFAVLILVRTRATVVAVAITALVAAAVPVAVAAATVVITGGQGGR